MRNYKITLLCLSLLFLSCGKPPILNKLENNKNDSNEQIFTGEYFPKEKINFRLSWTIKPTLENLSSFSLKLSKPLSESQTINTYIWMPDMGHGSSPIEISQLNTTDFIMSEIAVVMPGLWIIHIEILDNNQVIDKWQKSIVL